MRNIHPLANVHSLHIGEGTVVWQFAIILEKAVIGKNCNINCHTFIENDVVLGDNVTVKSGVYLWDGIQVEDHVFIGPNVTFANDKQPRSRHKPDVFEKTILRQGASIGAGSHILGGITIGRYAMIGMGSLVTKNIPNYALAYGSPARIHGWVDEKGNKLESKGENVWQNRDGKIFIETENGLIEK